MTGDELTAAQTTALWVALEQANAQTGVDTPDCDCGHDGMGESWHASCCAWIATGPAEDPPRWSSGIPGWSWVRSWWCFYRHNTRFNWLWCSACRASRRQDREQS